MALKSVAKGQMTIIDLTDSRQMTALIGSSNRRQVIYNPDTKEFLPNYATVNNVLSPELYLAGSPLNKIDDAKTVKWTVQTNSMGAFTDVVANQYYAFGAHGALVIKDNILKDNISMLYRVAITYHDVPLDKDILIQADIEMIRIDNGVSGSTELATMAILTNDAHTVSTDYQGNGGVYTSATTSMQVFEGATEQTSKWVIKATPVTGVTGTLVGNKYTLTGMTVDTGYVDLRATKGTEAITKRFTITKAKSGYTPVKGVDFFDGVKGSDGTPGTSGAPGKPGADGKTPYTHIAYANSEDGATEFSTKVSVNKKYVGMFTDFTETDSTTPSDYKWTLIKGADGSKGTPGTAGLNGKTPYFHVAYANSEDGVTGFSTTDAVGKAYIGQYTDYLEDDSEEPSKYTWILVKGADGADGANGSNGAPGKAGEDGKTPYTHIAYATNSTGTEGFSTTVSLGKTYVGMYTDFTKGDLGDASLYKWTLIKGSDGSNGIPGKAGLNGKTPYFHVAYANDITGSTGFSTSISEGKTYIGQYTDFLLEDSDVPSKYSWTLIKGADGESSYLWVRYSKVASGAGMTTDPTGASYMGTTTTDTPVPPALYSAYQWVKFVGNTGVPGEKGANGESSYLHIKYSNDGGTTFTGNVGEDFGDYIGKRIDNTLADSTTPSDYTWGKITGEDATSYQLLLSPKLVKKTATGVIDATTFTATGKSQKGVGEMNNYAGRFTIEEDIGAGYVRKYTSVGNEISKAYSISSSAKSYRVRLYLAGATSVLLDEETLTVVSDGATGSTGASGANAVLLNISMPDGDIIKNHTGNLKAVAELFEGVNLVTGTAYQWYARNPGGTGDADSGAGWNKLTTGISGGTTGFTSNTLTITPSAIPGTATFMVIATYRGKKLKREVTVQDITDTYTFATIGNGNYKNGQGSSVFTQKVYQDGIEVDKVGSKFRYQWNLYSNDGVMHPTFVKVGKTITVLATEYAGKGYLFCQVSE